MSTNLLQCLRDSATLTSLPDWVREEFEQAADEIQTTYKVIGFQKEKIESLAKDVEHWRMCFSEALKNIDQLRAEVEALRADNARLTALLGSRPLGLVIV